MQEPLNLAECLALGGLLLAAACAVVFALGGGRHDRQVANFSNMRRRLGAVRDRAKRRERDRMLRNVAEQGYRGYHR